MGLMLLSAPVPTNAQASSLKSVALFDDANNYTLSNRVLVAKVAKRSGDLVSLRYQGIETLAGGSGHPYGYWSHAPGRGAGISNSVTINPASNGGERAEVSVKGFFQGTPLGNGPGGSASVDIEIRYALGRDDSAIYTYSILEHKLGYPATSIGEARFGAKLDGRVFNWMTIDADRNKQMPSPEDWDQGTQMNMKEARRLNTGIYKGQVEHKYDYSAVQFEIPAFGWSSSERRIGLWFVNPSIEYLSGGPTKVELTGHLDNNAGAAPTLLNYWRGSHYGGSSCVIADGEAWSKVIGPFLIYCNSGQDPQGLWKDALARAARESDAWPYDWVSGVDYPHKNERGTVSGEIGVTDPGAPGLHPKNLLVGLAAPDYSTPAGRAGAGMVDWQSDAKHYEFWTRANDAGQFVIPKIRPGSYTLHAIADGVLGELSMTNVSIAAGETKKLGRLEWTPQRFGRQLWEIGVANRSAAEFRHGDHYWQWGLYNDYAKEFPDDVHFVIGKSDYHRDWNYAQLPRPDRPGGTVWLVEFNLPEAPKGKAVLRVALAAVSARAIEVSMNDHRAGAVTGLRDTATIRRDGIRGYWSERMVAFDAGLMKSGTNILKLAIPPGSVMNGIEYDYLRLELDEAGQKK